MTHEETKHSVPRTESVTAAPPEKKNIKRRRRRAPLSDAPTNDAKAAESKPADTQGKTASPKHTSTCSGASDALQADAVVQLAAAAPLGQSPSNGYDANSNGKKGRSRHKSAKKRRVFEVDNSDLPPGIPPVADFAAALPAIAKPTPTPAPEANALKTEDAAAQRPSAKPALPRRSAKPTRATQKDDETIAEIVERSLRANGPMSRQALVDLSGAPQIEAESVLLNLLDSGRLFLTKKRKYALPEQLGYLTGRLQTTAKGYGFLITEGEGEDVFVSQNNMNGALHGDTIVVRTMEGKGSSREGEVVAVTDRANTRIVGTLKKQKSAFSLTPDNARLGVSFEVEKGRMAGAKDGQKIVGEIVYRDNEPIVRVTEVLGYPDDAGTDVLAIISAHNIPQEFPRHVQSAARAIGQTVDEDDITRREDLRKLNTVTIDGSDAKDFDDAVSCERLKNGNYLLGVHIADVSQYVKENSALDKEALRRATSVYLVDRVIPMLPVELSNGICSLNPGVDRLTLTCFMEIDPRGRVVSHRIAETVINSHARFVYEDVTALLKGDAGLRTQYADFVGMLEDMESLAATLREARQKRGSIDFDLPESKIHVDERGRALNVGLYERGVSNRMIEEFMLICNETVAETMSYLERPMIYRVHEVPDDERISELNTFLGGFGMGLRGAQHGLRPKALQSVLETAKGRPGEAVISRVVLRSLKKARYAAESLGHFGLAAEFYCHFTSPIRRYPDLEVHRIVKDMLRGQLTDKRQEALRAKLPEIAQISSERERAAMEAERDVDDLKKCEYMAEHIGAIFKGVISGVTGFGLFVELPNTCEGMARLADLDDDYYDFDDKNYRVVGRHTRKIYRLGDPVTIQVVSVDTTARRVEFRIQRDADPTGRRPRRPKSK